MPRLGIEAFGLGRKDVLFVPFAVWDVAGAAWFGYPTFWLNRSGALFETLGVTPNATGSTFADLTAFVNHDAFIARATDPAMDRATSRRSSSASVEMTKTT